MRRYSLHFFIYIVLFIPTLAEAQSRSELLEYPLDPRGRAELTICSQNLENYGAYKDVARRLGGIDQSEFNRKEINLVRRFVRADCDVIAVQEVVGSTEEVSSQALQRLASVLHKKNNRFYNIVIGPSNDKFLRVGYLVAEDRAKVISFLSYARVQLPKLTEEQKPRVFSRGPLELQLKVKGLDGSGSRVVNLVNFHFKSKRGGSDDPAGLEFETFRMEMAEALRRIVYSRHRKSIQNGDSILVLLGDRNSNFDVASAKILEGVLTLKHFQENGPCRLGKRGTALCQGNSARAPLFFSVLLNDPETKLFPGTHRYKKVYSWLDEILMPAPALRFAWKNFDRSSNYDSGVMYEPKYASDHALVWVRLNW